MGVVKLSVLLPIFNEERGLKECLDRVLGTPQVSEVIAVNDCSTDATAEILSHYHDPRLIIVHHKYNVGKGGGIRTALAYASGDLAVIQDADTEYDPTDYGALLAPIEANRAEVVYGARDLTKQPLIGFLGNKFLTTVTNLLTGTRLSDMETCYKVVPTALLRELHLRSNGFEIEPEITVKLAKRHIKIIEVPVAYSPRNAKKLRRFRDGFRSLLALIRFLFE